MNLSDMIKGEVTLYKDGILLFKEKNLVVNACLPALANLVAGVTAGQYVTAIGFGSGNTAPAVTDTDLSATPKYYNSISSHSFPSSGSALFDYGLSTTADYAAEGIDIQELGLYANSASVQIPSYVGTGFSAWTASNPYTVGQMIVDSNGRIQRCTTAGTSGATHPVWATTLGNTTTDNTATWTLIAGASIPSPMYAHVVVPAFTFTSSGSYSGTWQLTF
ncbi:MAG: hypothetical protein KGL39_28155 [Patescibacteria group bacterium]|nr:hypothetical protein [Patescibacteria group bacterium]